MYLQSFDLTEEERINIEKYPKIHQNFKNDYIKWRKARQNSIKQLSKMSKYLKQLSTGINVGNLVSSVTGVPIGIACFACTVAAIAAPVTAGLSISVLGTIAAVAGGAGAVVAGGAIAANVSQFIIKKKKRDKLEKTSKKDKEVTDKFKETSKMCLKKFQQFIELKEKEIVSKWVHVVKVMIENGIEEEIDSGPKISKCETTVCNYLNKFMKLFEKNETNEGKPIKEKLKEFKELILDPKYAKAREHILLVYNSLIMAKWSGKSIFGVKEIVETSIGLARVIKAADGAADTAVVLSNAGKVAANFSKLSQFSKVVTIVGVVGSAIGLISDVVGVTYYSYQIHIGSPCELAKEIEQNIKELETELESLTKNCDQFWEIFPIVAEI